MPWITPHTLTPSAHSQSRSSCCHIGPSAPAPIPALLHSTCTAPYAASAASRSAATESHVVTSVGTPVTSSPSLCSSATVFSSGSGWMSASTTFMPARPNASPIARPMPPAPPVTIATLPFRSFMSVRADRRQVVVTLMHERRDPVGRDGRDDLAGLDAGPLGQLDLADRAHRQVHDRVEPRLTQDD